MDVLGSLHIFFAMSALMLGPVVFLRRKGGRWHRWIGYGFVLCMLALNVTALLIYELFDGWGLFHWLALVSLTTLGIGMVPALFRWAGWLDWHYYGMCWSYMGLAIAAGVETFVRLTLMWSSSETGDPPLPNFWVVTGVGMAAIGGLGHYLVNLKKLGHPAS